MLEDVRQKRPQEENSEPVRAVVRLLVQVRIDEGSQLVLLEILPKLFRRLRDLPIMVAGQPEFDLVVWLEDRVSAPPVPPRPGVLLPDDLGDRFGRPPGSREVNAGRQVVDRFRSVQGHLPYGTDARLQVLLDRVSHYRQPRGVRVTEGQIGRASCRESVERWVAALVGY